MGFGKFLGCVVGGALAVVAAPLVLPAAAAIGTAAAAAGAAVAGTAGAAAAAVGSTAVGAAVTGAVSSAAAAVGSSAVGAAVAGAAGAASTAAAGVAGVASTAAAGVAGAVGTAATAVGSSTIGAAVAGAASTVGTAVGSAVGVTALEATVAAGIGVATSYSGLTTAEGFRNKEEAESLINSAKSEYEMTKRKLENKINFTTERLAKLNELKMKIYSTDIRQSIDIISKIVVPKEKQMEFIDSKKITYFFNEDEIKEMKVTAIQAVDVVKQIASGANLMAAAASGTLGFMSQFGIASTGRAISSLSGAAAKRAALAALGGGAKAAGGGGMALGSSVLGGITLLPTAMIMSWNFAKETEKALTEAKAHYAKVKKEIEKMNSVILVLERGVDVRIDELYWTIDRLSQSFKEKVLVGLNDVYARNKDAEGKVYFKNCSKEDQEKIKLSAYFVRKMKDILAVKVLDSEGNPSKESKNIMDAIANDKQISGVVQFV
jgi:hypothetical protein